MPRILGVDIPKEKRIEVALTYVFGVGPTTSKKVLKAAGIDLDVRAKTLTDEDVSRIAAIIQKDYKVEGDLKREISSNIKRYIEIHSYRGHRHRRHLPCRGQRTHTNARTRKGPKKSGIVGKKKIKS